MLYHLASYLSTLGEREGVRVRRASMRRVRVRRARVRRVTRVSLNLNDEENDFDVISSNMQGKSILEALLFQPALKRDVSHGCAPF